MYIEAQQLVAINNLSAVEINLIRAWIDPTWRLPHYAENYRDRMAEAVALAERQSRKEQLAGQQQDRRCRARPAA